MEEEWPPTPGGRPTVAEKVEEEPEVETEIHRARATGRIRGTKSEHMEPATEVERRIQMAAVEEKD